MPEMVYHIPNKALDLAPGDAAGRPAAGRI